MIKIDYYGPAKQYLREQYQNSPAGALFSEDRKHRYVLWRIWDRQKPFIMFVGLNPSTANENKNDPTIQRIITFARKWGYGGVFMANLFTVVSSSPGILRTEAEITLDNDHDWLHAIADICKDTCFAWGTFKETELRAPEVISLFPNAVCLGKTKDGSPKHPLYIRSDVSPSKYRQ